MKEAGCIGIVLNDLGVKASKPDFGNCYSSFSEAEKRQTEMRSTNECSKFRDCYGDISYPKIFTLRFYNAGVPLSKDAATGKVTVPAGWDKGSTPGETNPYGNPLPVNFDIGIYNEDSKTF
jgi:hypothetical protein